MRFELKLALRYLSSKRKGLVRFTALIAVVGIALGVASLIIAQALAKGFGDEMRDKVLINTSHITISSEGESHISNWEIIKNRIEKVENVSNVEPTTYESAVVLNKDQSSYGVIRVKTPDNSNKKIGSTLPSVGIGKELAKRLKLKKGDKADIIIVGKEETPTNSEIIIGGVFETGLYEYDSTWVYISQADYTKVKGISEFKPKTFSVFVNDIFRANETAEKIKSSLGKNFKVLAWQEANKPLFAALSLERKVSFAIISLIILIAALNVTTTLSLLVNERKLDIAVLRTCGAKSKNLVMIFLFEGLLLSFTGIVLGVFLGLSACFMGNYFKLIQINQEVYSLNYIPFRPDFFAISQTIFITFLICLAATLYPIVKASKIKPLENFRVS